MLLLIQVRRYEQIPLKVIDLLKFRELLLNSLNTLLVLDSLFFIEFVYVRISQMKEGLVSNILIYDFSRGVPEGNVITPKQWLILPSLALLLHLLEVKVLIQDSLSVIKVLQLSRFLWLVFKCHYSGSAIINYKVTCRCLLVLGTLILNYFYL